MSGVPAQRRGAVSASVGRRLRGAATTEPGRLRIVGAVLALLVVAFGAVTAVEAAGRAAAADDVVSRSQPLSADAAAVYRSLADADTMAASGFLAGTEEPANVRAQYEKDIQNASRLLVKAAANTEATTSSGREIRTMNELLPVYTGLVERARANNRLGLPLGGAYLRYANQKMSGELLPAAERLYTAETGRLDADQRDARQWPLIAIAAGFMALTVLVWAQRRDYRRTHRVFNRGLLAATAATAAVLVWLVVGQTLARTELHHAMANGQASLDVLNDARIASLKARANENLTLVARGAVLTEDGSADQYQTDYTAEMDALRTELGKAGKLADDASGSTPVATAVSSVSEWQKRHADARKTDDGGDYEGALALVIGAKGSTGECFSKVDAALETALAHEQKQFDAAAGRGRGALGGLPVGAAALAVLAAVAAITGTGRRLGEYR
ncbi:hypothetical protein [Streptomyces sp. NBC_00102]|uniref:hypothetical protein n=1 Tax=Streptomyces sp. NBC_00102 TaxID=2975652 RepID=UPI002253FD11|nr:hypothetical protein [Streptomyces sp. NBC_00102]MCX5397048.1 hypothetical protein [Streptomyces sp. NBC_00102]